LQLGRLDGDVLERVWGMSWWATRGHEQVKELNFSGGFIDHALGAVLGAMIGDALGAPLGGRDPLGVTPGEVEKAMEMCGGGTWGVAPGQVTGNSELATCLAESLAEAEDPVAAFPVEDLAVRYGRWGKSFPFRGDRSCLQAFQRPLPADSMKERAREVNQKAEGSGCLLRSTAFAVLAASSSVQVWRLVDEDAQLSHPSRIVSAASMAYVMASASLIRTGGDRKRSLLELQNWLQAKLTTIKSGLSGNPEEGPRGFTHLSRGVQPPLGQRPAQDADTWAPPGEEHPHI